MKCWSWWSSTPTDNTQVRLDENVTTAVFFGAPNQKIQYGFMAIMIQQDSLISQSKQSNLY